MAKNTIGQFIAALRKANGFTQQEVADRLNVSNKAVSRWERDESAPDLSVIPALAELLGVTCDELLKGERIVGTSSGERKEPKVEKQVKALINRTLSGFKTLILIALAVGCVGIVCMFGISYGFYRPVIGFSVMLLFEVCAFALTALAVSKARDVKEYHELFALADEAMKEKYLQTVGSQSFSAFFLAIAATVASLPLALVHMASGFVNSVMPLGIYFLYFFLGISLLLVFLWLRFRTPYLAWVTGKPAVDSGKSLRPMGRKRMSFLQIGLTLLAGLLFVLAPYFDLEPRQSSPLYTAVALLGLGCLLGNGVCFLVSLLGERENRKGLLLPGIRNLLLIPSALILTMAQSVSWSMGSEGTVLGRSVHWYPEYIFYALTLAALVSLVFGIIERTVRKRPAGGSPQ